MIKAAQARTTSINLLINGLYSSITRIIPVSILPPKLPVQPHHHSFWSKWEGLLYDDSSLWQLENRLVKGYIFSSNRDVNGAV